MRSYFIYAIAVASLSVLTITYSISKYIKRRKQLQKPPKNAKWQYVGTVAEIAIYPVRSGAAILLNEVECKTDGLHSEELKDRCLFLSDKNGEFIYAATYPKMLSITTDLRTKNALLLKAPDMKDLFINLALLMEKEPIIRNKPNFKHYLVEGEPEHHEWFSKVVLNKSQGLTMYFTIKTEFQYNLWGEDKSDFIPVMVMHNKSVNDLNQRLTSDDQAHHLQFRGNVLINSMDNIKPYAEDHWSWLRFGEQRKVEEKKNCILHYHAPCLRCILTNVDITNCKRNPNFEPLKTLKKYRLIHDTKEPTLGAYYKVHQPGTFKSNDPVYAIVS